MQGVDWDEGTCPSGAAAGTGARTGTVSATVQHISGAVCLYVDGALVNVTRGAAPPSTGSAASGATPCAPLRNGGGRRRVGGWGCSAALAALLADRVGCRRRGNSTHDIAVPRQSKRRCLTSPAAMLSSLLASPPTVSRCPAVPAARWLPSSSFSPESGARSRQPPLALPRQCRRVGRRSINRICRRATQPVQSGPSQPNACLYSLDGSYS